KALRARVNEFFQDLVDGEFRKAYELVAEDTKDEFFTMGKTPLKAYSLNGISYSEDFTHASVQTSSKKTVYVQGAAIEMPSPSVTTWKIENGKWVWYHAPNPTHNIMGIGEGTTLPQASAAGNAASATKPPSNEDIQAALREAMSPAHLDRTEVTFP